MFILCAFGDSPDVLTQVKAVAVAGSILQSLMKIALISFVWRGGLSATTFALQTQRRWPSRECPRFSDRGRTVYEQHCGPVMD
jgi:hypothetical protein